VSLAQSLEALSDVAAKAAPALTAANPVAGVAAGLVAVALRAGAAFAEAGKDPLIEISRILSAESPVAEVLDERSAALDDKFGRRE